jgi:hypothetical protein
MVENNAYQQSLIDWLSATEDLRTRYPFWVKVQAFTTGKQKSDPDMGLPSLDVEFNNEAWFVCMDEVKAHEMATCKCGWCVWLREVDEYPISATNDCVMAMWFFREAARMMMHSHTDVPAAIGESVAGTDGQSGYDDWGGDSGYGEMDQW